MKLYEHQGKALFSEAGISVPAAKLVSSPDELDAALQVSGLPCVLKAQLLIGRRGKAGLIQIAETRDDALRKAETIFASPQKVKTILVEQKLDIVRELYLSVTLDPVASAAVLMASTQGGMDVEEMAEKSPQSIVRESVDVMRGLMPFNLRNLLAPLGLNKDLGRAVAKTAEKIYALWRKYDALLVEINPLAITKEGKVIAADAKVDIDDHALFRQPFEHVPEEYADEVEFEAAQEGIPYLRFDGDIGLMCAGAGLTNTVFDLIHHYGGKPANFLEFGGPNYRKALQAMRLTLKSNAKVILIVTFGTIARADVMAEGIAEAIRELKPTIPIVTAIRGTNEEAATETLRAIGLEPLMDSEEAVKRAVALARGGAQ